MLEKDRIIEKRSTLTNKVHLADSTKNEDNSNK